MTISEYTFLINKPDAISDKNENGLNAVIEKYPYFQSARILRLKQLYNQDSYKYNYALKVVAAFTTDRSVLFDFITSSKFITLQNTFFDNKTATLLNIKVTDAEIVESSFMDINKVENESDAPLAHDSQSTVVNLNLGKPLVFSVDEKHSFQEWLQLSRLQPIDRESTADTTNSKTKHETIIDNFIAANPKIPALNKQVTASIKIPTIEEKSYLMTETLAKVYLEQKKYQRAIQAYEILILKYPEKSSYFVNLILEIKNLQQNTNS
jgi:hypothetical protein